MLPRHILDHLPVNTSHMWPNNIMAKVYYGLPRQVIGDIDIKLVIGHKLLNSIASVKYSSILQYIIRMILVSLCKHYGILPVSN